MSSERGLLFIVSAPSGTGKTTLVERLVTRVPRLRMSRSYTSRPARAGERDGLDYNFVSRARFEAMVAAGEFLEWADVFGNLYGTAAADTERQLAAGDGGSQRHYGSRHGSAGISTELTHRESRREIA